jgi:hypothetical protein
MITSFPWWPSLAGELVFGQSNYILLGIQGHLVIAVLGYSILYS